ncbi:MAG: OmpA family protein [Sneathiella sp.]
MARLDMLKLLKISKMGLIVPVMSIGTLTFVAPAFSQTVVIGGAGGASVQVNMGAVYPRTATTQPFRNSTALPMADYSKSSRIVYGDEVITLVPPGSQPKKTRKTVKKRAPQKAPLKTVTKIEKTAEPAPQKVEMTRVESDEKETLKPVEVEKKASEAPSMPDAKKEQPTSVEAPATAEEPKTVKTEATSSPVLETAKAEPAAEAKTESAPAAETAPIKESSPRAEQATSPSETSPKTETAAAAPAEEKPAEKEIQVAAITPEKKAEPPTQADPAPAVPSVEPAASQIFFKAEKSTLPGAAEADLQKIAQSLKENEGRVQLIAYADAGSNSAARRLSLGRALVVRSKLMELGVPNNRIEVRALGKPNDGSPADRVDLKVIAR